MKKVRWGVLGTANIATGKVLPSMQQGTYCDITAIASRSLEKARATATQLGILKAYGSYEELLADPEIDAIYNPLPNHLHVPWSIKALQAGKHVLLRKTDSSECCRSAGVGRCRQTESAPEGDGSVHVSLSSAMAARPATGPRRKDREIADDPVILLVLS